MTWHEKSNSIDQQDDRSDRRLFVRVSGKPGNPDGREGIVFVNVIALPENFKIGCVWILQYQGYKINQEL